jgi:glycosyltransferase involved in cell wall biosynthesis
MSNKIAILTITYNEDWILESCIKNWEGKVHKHLVLHSDKPWHGTELPHDNSQSICEKYPHVEFVRLNWRSEQEQRNWGLAKLYDYDYVFIVDSDELYTTEDQFKILDRVGQVHKFEDNNYCYRIDNIITFFKRPDYILDPPDSHHPLFAVNPKKILFKEHRIPNSSFQIPIDVKLYHATYLRPDIRLFTKLGQFEHYDQIKKNWFTEKWLKWTPEMDDLRSYGHEKSKAVKYDTPQEILNLLNML